MGGYSLPSRGVLIRFTLHDPQYYVDDGKAISKRAEEIKSVVQVRADSPVIVSRNCLEGKELFDILEQHLIR